MKEDKTKAGHGGKRQNAGRKRRDTEQLNVRISNTALEKLSRIAEDQGENKAQIIERLIRTL